MEGNGNGTLGQLVRRAASVRWALARDRGLPVEVHELLELDAARRVIDRIDNHYSGLREYVNQAEATAQIAAELQIAQASNCPAAIVDAIHKEFLKVEERLGMLRGTIGQIPDVAELLQAYAEVADVTGILDEEEGEGLS